MIKQGRREPRGQSGRRADLFNVCLVRNESGLHGAGGDARLMTEVVVTEEVIDGIESIQNTIDGLLQGECIVVRGGLVVEVAAKI